MLFFERIARLEREHVSFAIATVVARRSPVSSHLGDRALVFADGRMEGFVGGSCSRDIVRRHAQGAIRSRLPVLLQIRPDSRDATDTIAPDDGPPNAERVVIPMSCSSEGAVDVYIEPRLPLRRLIVVGFTPVAEALAQIAVTLDYDVVRVVIEDELRDLTTRMWPALDPRRESDASEDATDRDARHRVRVVELKSLPAFIDALDSGSRHDLVAVVASQGHYDELALEVLLARPIAFVGLLASRRRATTVVGVLAQQGLPAERIAAITNPVGLDIGARSPGEVAVSILAQIIANAQNAPASVVLPAEASVQAASTQASPIEIDPVCGMDVEIAGALYRFGYLDNTYFFCGAHCRASFAADPERYLLPLGSR